MIETARADEARILQWADSDSLENVPANKFGPLMALLKAKAAKRPQEVQS